MRIFSEGVCVAFVVQVDTADFRASHQLIAPGPAYLVSVLCARQASCPRRGCRALRYGVESRVPVPVLIASRIRSPGLRLRFQPV